MRYLLLDTVDREEVMTRLGLMPDYLDSVFAGLAPEDLTAPGPDGSFSPVEHCWHLADLEREGFAERIRRLTSEQDPQLPDFDGDRAARERRYRSRSLAEGISAFREARLANLEVLSRVHGDVWVRGGVQDGVGPVSLCDIPTMMLEHDTSHRREIVAWIESRF